MVDIATIRAHIERHFRGKSVPELRQYVRRNLGRSIMNVRRHELIDECVRVYRNRGELPGMPPIPDSAREADTGFDPPPSEAEERRESETRTPPPPPPPPPPVAKPVDTGRIGTAIDAVITGALENLSAQVAELRSQSNGGVDVAAVKAIIADVLDKTPVIKIRVGDAGKVKTIGAAHRKLPELIRAINKGAKVWIVGPAGSGKTEGVKQAFTAIGCETFILEPQATPYDVKGFAKSDGTLSPTALTDWAMYEGDAGLLVDEFDGNFPAAQLAMNLTLGNGFVNIPGNGLVDVTHGGKFRKVVVATANTYGLGGDSDYVGRMKIDGATRNRLHYTIMWDYDKSFERKLAMAEAKAEGATETELETVERFVDKVHAIRAHLRAKKIKLIASPRQTFFCARALVGDGKFTEKDLMHNSILGTATPEKAREIIRGAGVEV